MLGNLSGNMGMKVALLVVLGLYLSFVLPRIDSQWLQMLDNTLVKLIALALVVFLSMNSPEVALMLVVAYVVSLLYSQRSVSPVVDSPEPVKTEEEPEPVSQDEQSERESFSLMNQPTVDHSKANVVGYNARVDCAANCCSEHSDSVGKQCEEYGAYKGGYSAQGLGCPVPGYEDMGCGAEF